MARLIMEDVSVTSLVDGEESPARLAVCDCGSRRWFVLQIRGRSGWHLRLQCAGCDVSYCRGDCDGPEGRG